MDYSLLLGVHRMSDSGPAQRQMSASSVVDFLAD